MKKIILLFCFIPCLLGAQSKLTGKEILHQLTIAAGGDLWQQPQSLQLSGNARWTPFGKTDSNESLYFDTYKMYRVFPSQNLAAHAANGKIRFDAKYANNTYMQLIFDGQKTLNYLSDKAKPYQKYFSWSNNFGFGIIRFADRDSFSVERLADDQIEGYPCYVVQITDPKKMVTTFSIDQKTFYIRGVSFITDIGFHNRIYSDFEKLQPANKASGYFIQARRIRLYFDGIKWMDINWTNNEVNGNIQDEVFSK
jgi:hypothetical protein